MIILNKGKLSTIQKRENLNYVTRLGEKGNGGAYCNYEIFRPKDIMYVNETPKTLAYLEFQQGNPKSEDSRDGVTDQDLLEIVRDRLTGFCNGDLSTKETEKALEHIEIALMYLNKRTEDRIERQVIGTHQE